jgi:hypothetical protein
MISRFFQIMGLISVVSAFGLSANAGTPTKFIPKTPANVCFVQSGTSDSFEVKINLTSNQRNKLSRMTSTSSEVINTMVLNYSIGNTLDTCSKKKIPLNGFNLIPNPPNSPKRTPISYKPQYEKFSLLVENNRRFPITYQFTATQTGAGWDLRPNKKV